VEGNIDDCAGIRICFGHCAAIKRHIYIHYPQKRGPVRYLLGIFTAFSGYMGRRCMAQALWPSMEGNLLAAFFTCGSFLCAPHHDIHPSETSQKPSGDIGDAGSNCKGKKGGKNYLYLSGAFFLGAVGYISHSNFDPLCGLITANPIGAPIAHMALQVAAFIHASKTNLFLPPHH
jgi:hypothetical protein